MLEHSRPVKLWLSTDFSAETLQARREWHDKVKVLKGRKKTTAMNTLPDKVIIQNGRRKGFPEKQKGVFYHYTGHTVNSKGLI